MALSTYAHFGVQEFKDYGGIVGTGKDPLIETLANQASEYLDGWLGRQVVSRGVLTEYHSLEIDGSPLYTSELRLLEWPVISITEVAEDTAWPRTYGASYVLVSGTDYTPVNPKGLLRRIATTGERCWATGRRAIRVKYTAGYANTAGVSTLIKSVAMRYAALLYAELTRSQLGISSQSDAAGNFTRFSAAQLTPAMQAELASERRVPYADTGERDAA